MSKERIFEPYQKAERSIIKKYRKQLWSPFIYAIKHYDLIQEGDRIAQLLFAPVLHAQFEVCDSLSETERGEGGFGSTGK